MNAAEEAREESTIIVRWRRSRSAEDNIIWREIGKLPLMTLRSCAIAASILLALRYEFERSVPTLPWNVYMWGGSIAPAALYLLLAAGLWWNLRRGGRPFEYKITRDGIVVPSDKVRLIRWKVIDSFTVEEDRVEDAGARVKLHLKSGYSRPIPLTTDGTTLQILQGLRSRLPERPPLPKYAPFRGSDAILGAIMLVIFAGVITFLCQRYQTNLRGRGEEFMLGLMLLGPGSWMVLLRFGRRAPGALFTAYVVMNQLGLLIGVCILMSFRQPTP